MFSRKKKIPREQLMKTIQKLEQQIEYKQMEINIKNKITEKYNILNKKYQTLEIKIKDIKSNEEIISLKTLKKMNIKFPHFQRSVEQERVDELYNNIKENPNFIVPLYIGLIKKDYYIIDGQHRLTALYNLDKLENIKIKTIKCKDMEELQKYFFIINDSLRVPDVYKNPDKKELTIYKETYERLKKNYKSYFTIKKTRKPTINTDEFMTKLQESNIIEERAIINSKQLYELFENLNEKYFKNCYEKAMEKAEFKKYPGLKSVVSKMNKVGFGFFVFLDNNWQEHLKDENFTAKKLAIPTDVKEFVWKVNYGKIEKDICKCCDINEIRNTNFECGHIIAEKNGGVINRFNLYPICGKCNKSMGTRNMFEYMIHKNKNINLARIMESLYNSNKELFTS